MASKLLGAANFKQRMLAARQNRYIRFQTRLVWLADKLTQKVTWGMATRLRVACQLLRDKVVLNISYPVTKYKSKLTGRTVVDPASRSKPGQFPHADTTRLMKDVYWVVNDKALEGKVGTTLDYGLILELEMNRSFLIRTWQEMKQYVLSVLLAGGGTVFQEYPPAGPASGGGAAPIM